MRAKVLTATLLATLSLAAGCRDTATKARSPRTGGQPGPGSVVTLALKLPAAAQFQFTGADLAKHVAAYHLTIASPACPQHERRTTRPFVHGGVLAVEIHSGCDYELTLSLGKPAAGNAFVDYYKTNPPVTLDPKTAAATGGALALHFERMPAAAALGFKAALIETAPPSKKTAPAPAASDLPAAGSDTPEPIAKVTYAALKATVDAQCSSCHRPGGTRAASDLTTPAGVDRYKDAVVGLVIGKRMPPGRPLTLDEITLFAKWRDDGYLPAGASSSSAPATGAAPGAASSPLGSAAPSMPATPGAREFRIKAGTGAGAWNSAATTVTFRVGETLRIYNDDTTAHQLHTNGAPCPHGNVIKPGGYADCKATRAYSGEPLYDHNSRGSFFLRVDP